MTKQPKDIEQGDRIVHPQYGTKHTVTYVQAFGIRPATQEVCILCTDNSVIWFGVSEPVEVVG